MNRQQSLQQTLENLYSDVTDLTIMLTPPSNFDLNLPCLLYNFKSYGPIKSNNDLYTATEDYELQFLNVYPPTTLPRRILQLENVKHIRNFTKDNIVHTVFQITMV